MLFWTLAALLTLAASLTVMLPFLRSRQTEDEADAYDMEVYRDQLAEIDRDSGRGLIRAAEAQEARAEIGRRILGLHHRNDGEAAGGDGRADARRRRSASLARLTAAAAVLAVPLISWSFYAALGSPDLPSEPLQARLAKSPEDSTLEELVARAEAHLAADPDDARGWDVLAPVYFRMGRYDDAVTAYRNALRLDGDSAQRLTGLGEAVTAKNQGIVSSDAEDAFRRAISIEPDNAKGRFFLAMALGQDGKMEDARRMWTAMKNDLPASSPWREAVDEALGSQASTADTAANVPGPSAQDVEAASQMSQDDRRGMVEGMVAKLDQRLRDNPGDAQGWQRLMRSYMVLDRKDDARDALNRGVGALGKDSDEARKLNDLALSLGIIQTR